MKDKIGPFIEKTPKYRHTNQNPKNEIYYKPSSYLTPPLDENAINHVVAEYLRKVTDESLVDIPTDTEDDEVEGQSLTDNNEYIKVLSKLDKLFETDFVSKLNDLKKSGTDDKFKTKTIFYPSTLGGGIFNCKFNIFANTSTNLEPISGTPILQERILILSKEDKVKILNAVLKKISSFDRKGVLKALNDLKSSGAVFEITDEYGNISELNILFDERDDQENDFLESFDSKSFIVMKLNVDKRDYEIDFSEIFNQEIAARKSKEQVVKKENVSIQRENDQVQVVSEGPDNKTCELVPENIGVVSSLAINKQTEGEPASKSERVNKQSEEDQKNLVITTQKEAENKINEQKGRDTLKQGQGDQLVDEEHESKKKRARENWDKVRNKVVNIKRNKTLEPKKIPVIDLNVNRQEEEQIKEQKEKTSESIRGPGIIFVVNGSKGTNYDSSYEVNCEVSSLDDSIEEVVEQVQITENNTVITSSNTDEAPDSIINYLMKLPEEIDKTSNNTNTNSKTNDNANTGNTGNTIDSKIQTSTKDANNSKTNETKSDKIVLPSKSISIHQVKKNDENSSKGSSEKNQVTESSDNNLYMGMFWLVLIGLAALVVSIIFWYFIYVHGSQKSVIDLV
jgi:hypothetical protein